MTSLKKFRHMPSEKKKKKKRRIIETDKLTNKAKSPSEDRNRQIDKQG